MLLDIFPFVLWINLEKSIDRKNKMVQKLNDYKINNMRISAIDGTNNKTSELDKICIISNKISLAENACTCSHLLAIKHFYENIDNDEIIIFEDDVSFEFLQYIPYNWSNFRKTIPINFNIIQLAIATYNPINKYLIKTSLVNKYYCSAAYLITKKYAKILVEKYFDKDGKINLSNKNPVTIDLILSNSGATYSIPIFTYETDDSTIHKEKYWIKKSKMQQLQLWMIKS